MATLRNNPVADSPAVARTVEDVVGCAVEREL
jgi:hypothetical protein